MAFEITVIAPIGAMGDPNSSDIWAQDNIILEESGSCMYVLFISPKALEQQTSHGTQKSIEIM